MFLSLSDEDMQSLASLMSVKPTDIGNLDDFNESDEDEDKKSVTAVGVCRPSQTLFPLSDFRCEEFPLTFPPPLLPFFPPVIPITSSALLFFGLQQQHLHTL